MNSRSAATRLEAGRAAARGRQPDTSVSGTEYAQAIIAKNARIDQLREALVDLIQNVGGHDHWREGGAGGTCATCERQNAALARAREALNA